MPDVLDVCDAVVAKIQVAIAVPPPGKPAATVERVYEFAVPDKQKGLASLVGRRVYVFPAGYSQTGLASRGDNEMAFEVFVLVVERYAGDVRPVPRAWMDERVKWARANVFDTLGDVRGVNLLALGDRPNTSGLYPDANECQSVYDLVTTTEHAAFWGEFSFTFKGHQ